MPSVDDVYNQLLQVNGHLATLHNDLVNLTSELVTIGQYTNQALYQNDQQNDTIICILEHISQNTCALLNQAALQTAAQTHMERDIDGLEGMFATANPGAALERERLHRLEEKIEKCCPPTPPTPPCTFTKCPAPKPIGPPPQVGVVIQTRG
jgi:hypothetical protein